MILDPHAQVLSLNHALERMTGWRSEEASGHDHDDVIVWKKRESTDLKQALDDGWPFNHSAERDADAARGEDRDQEPDGGEHDQRVGGQPHQAQPADQPEEPDRRHPEQDRDERLLDDVPDVLHHLLGLLLAGQCVPWE